MFNKTSSLDVVGTERKHFITHSVMLSTLLISFYSQKANYTSKMYVVTNYNPPNISSNYQRNT